jgi:hypothetical protein
MLVGHDRKGEEAGGRPAGEDDPLHGVALAAGCRIPITASR